MKKSRFIAIRLIFALLFLSVVAQNSYSEPFLVKTIYFRPTDAPPIEKMNDRIIKWMTETQDFYRSEMIRNGFDAKTFKLKRLPNNDIKIYVVNAKHNSAHYSNDTYNKIRPELPLELENPNDGHWQDNINVILLGGVRVMDGWVSGYGWCWSGGRYGGICVNTIKNRTDQNMFELIFHEMAHTLGLYHKPIHFHWHKLEHYEARWLNEHHLFNDNHGNRGWNGTLPRMTKQYDIIPKDEDLISIKFDLEGLNNLHQAQIFRVSNITVLSHHYFNGSKNGTAVFDISRKLVNNEDLLILQVMDKDGNFIMKYVDIEVPFIPKKEPEAKEEIIRPKNSDIGKEEVKFEVKPKDKRIFLWGNLKKR